MTGLELFREVRAQNVTIPFVIITGAGSEYLAVEALKAGVDDYIIKDVAQGFLDLLPILLPEVLQNYRNRAARQHVEAEQAKLVVELKAAFERIKTLSGLLPICSECKKIRDDQGYWNLLEAYIEKHADVEFSHGICPDCLKKLYPKYYQNRYGKGRLSAAVRDKANLEVRIEGTMSEP